MSRCHDARCLKLQPLLSPLSTFPKLQHELVLSAVPDEVMLQANYKDDFVEHGSSHKNQPPQYKTHQNTNSPQQKTDLPQQTPKHQQQPQKMTTILPITPRTPSSLLAALCLAPVLAPLNASSDEIPPVPELPDISLRPPTPIKPHGGPDRSTRTDPEPTCVQLCSFPRDSMHRRLSPNEARQLTLLMTQHFMPARHSSKAMMEASIRLAEALHQHGIRWDRHRRVMGTHLRGIWEEGLRLVGGSEHIMRLCRPGPME